MRRGKEVKLQMSKLKKKNRRGGREMVSSDEPNEFGKEETQSEGERRTC